jgi:hypothetical protein
MRDKLRWSRCRIRESSRRRLSVLRLRREERARWTWMEGLWHIASSVAVFSVPLRGAEVEPVPLGPCFTEADQLRADSRSQPRREIKGRQLLVAASGIESQLARS